MRYTWPIDPSATADGTDCVSRPIADPRPTYMNVPEAKLILENELSRYRAKSYDQLISLLGQPETFERISPSGTKYQIEIEVFFDDDSKSTLRVSGDIDDGGWRAFSPLSDDFLITPDGSFIDEG